MKAAFALCGSALLVGVVAGRNVTESGPMWGCGLLGPLPGISSDGSATAEMQSFIDGLRSSSDFGKVHYWNWNLAPMINADSKKPEYLTKDFLFMPEQWGVEQVKGEYVRLANMANFVDSEGNVCPATMADIFLGANEPDITGSCMGDMMGECTAPCLAGEAPCPTAHLDGEPGTNHPNANGRCDCWSDSHATGVGYWPVGGGACEGNQPLPHVYENDPGCLSNVVDTWRETAATAVSKGYKYLTAPLMAVDMDFMRAYVEEACKDCQDISCGCPSHVGWHFYASDCRPESLGGYADFQRKLDATKQLMEDYPFIKGAIVNEVGMLNCYQEGPASICLPNGPDQMYPAIQQPNHACPASDELPNGLATFLEKVMDMVMSAKTSDGRSVVSAFSWFNEDMAGGTYNLRLFDDDGNVNSLGQAYMKKCQEWSGKGPAPSPTPTPAPSPQPTPTPSPQPTPTPSPQPTPTPSPPTPTPTPTPTPPPTPTPTPPPAPSCSVGDAVSCPGSSAMCAGSQCCPDGSTCPSADNSFSGCAAPKTEDCTTASIFV